MDGGINLLGYGISTLQGLLVLGVLIFAAMLWREPETHPGTPTRLTRAAGARWLEIGLLAIAGAFMLGPSLFALLLS